jgi:hypothetical protein
MSKSNDVSVVSLCGEAGIRVRCESERAGIPFETPVQTALVSGLDVALTLWRLSGGSFPGLETESAQKCVARYSVFGVAISKVCRCLGIPKPPRGYWAKRAAGHRTTPRPRLPEFENKNVGKKHRSG